MSRTRPLFADPCFAASILACVAGSAFAQSRSSVESPSPVSVVQSDDIARSGITDVSSLVPRYTPGGQPAGINLRGVGRGYDFRPGGFALGEQGGPQLRIGGSLQFNYTASFRDDDEIPAADGEGFSHGFQRPNTRIIFDADVTSGLGAYVSLNATSISTGAPSGDSDVTVEEAYGVWTHDSGFSIRFGQFKVGHLYEELIPSEYQLFTERSIANEYLGQQFSEGIEFGYESDEYRLVAAAHDGFGTWDTRFESGDEADIAWSFRGDWAPTGDLVRFGDFTSFRGNGFGWRLGAGFTYALFGETGAGSSGVPAQDEQDRFDWTIDTQLEGDGWNVFASYAGMSVDFDDDLRDDITSHAVAVQGGAFLTDQLELIARYDGLFPDEDDVGTSDNSFNFLTLGANYYIVPNSHVAKVTLDLIYSFDDTMPLGMLSNNNGVRPVGAGSLNNLLGQTDEGETRFRAQVQVLF